MDALGRQAAAKEREYAHAGTMGGAGGEGRGTVPAARQMGRWVFGMRAAREPGRAEGPVAAPPVPGRGAR